MNTNNMLGSQYLPDELFAENVDTIQDQVEAAKRKREKLDPSMKFFVEANFHRSNLLTIKKNLKGRCTFIAHEEEKGKYFIKAIMKNETGGKDTVRFSLGGTPEEMSEKDYEELYTQLSTMNYVARGSQEGV